MNTDKNNRRYSMLLAISLLFTILITAFFISNLIRHSGINKYIDKTYEQSMSIKSDENFFYKGRTYRIILSTPKDKKDELYLQCFKEVLGGTFYKPTYGAIQGKSKSLYGMVINSTSSSNNEKFLVLYGYNKGLKANKLYVKPTNTNKWLREDISNKEYFMYIYPNTHYPTIEFKDINNNNITEMFIDK